MVTASDIEMSLKEQLKLASLVCTGLKTKFDSYDSFHVSFSEDDFPLTDNTGVLPSGCSVAPFYRCLSADQVYSGENSVVPRLPLPSIGSDAACDLSVAGSSSSVNYDRVHRDGDVSIS
jgi:hypothetical protein